MGWILFALAVVFIGSLPWQIERRKVTSEQMRDAAPGRFAKLSQGVTHYQWLGAKDGEVLVFIHGLTTPSPVFYALADGLGKRGYRVLVYDLYGRGYSDAPRGRQNRRFFLQQLEDLLEHQRLNAGLTVLGYSMGATIATAFAARHPRRMKHLILLAGGGVRLREDGLTRFCRLVPLIGDWVFAMILQGRERRALRESLGKTFDVKGIIELQLAEYSGQGFLRSVLSSRRHMLDEVQRADHELLRAGHVAVSAIWAEKDEVIPLSCLGMLNQWNRSARQEVIPGAEHGLAYTHSEAVVNVLAEMLDSAQ